MQNRQITIVSVLNPFNFEQRKIEVQAYKKRKKLSTYLQGNPIVCSDTPYSVSVNGRILDKSEYNLPVACNSYIAVLPIVAGGDDGKAILGIIASIALSVAAASVYSGVMKATSSAILAGLAAGAVSFVGGLIVNAITPQPKLDMTSTKQSNTYGWSQGTPIGNQGGAVGITYGRVRPSVQVLAQHISTDGNKQYMNLLLCGGEGPVDSISDIRVNDNPIGNYKEVQLDIRLGTNEQAVIPNFNDQYADQGLSFELGAEYSKQALNSNATQGVEVTIELPAGLFYSNDRGGLDSTWVDIAADYRRMDEEEWTPFVRSAATYHPHNRGIELIGAGAAGVYRFTESANSGDTRHVYINGPNGYHRELSFVASWGTVDVDIFRLNKDIGMLDGVNITTAHSSGRISAAQTSALRRTYRMDNLDTASYEVRVACVAKGGDSTRHSNKVYWTQVSSIVYDDMSRPGKVLIGIKALATSQLSGGIPKISWIQERKHVWVYVPKNGYAQLPADNPAWAAYDLIHRCKQLKDVRTGEDVFSASGAPHSRIIYQEFAEWAEFCESKRLKLNLFMDTAADLWSKLQYIEEVGRGKTTLKGTRFGCICDKPSQAVQLFTMGNILSGSFNEDFLPMRDRANAVEITFNNAARDYERDTLIVYADDYDTSQEVKNPTQIALDGITEFDQAFREAKYRLYLNRYLIRTISFEANVDSIACQVGDVIKFQHDVPQWGYGGRILEVNADGIKLDQVVSMESGCKYLIMIRKSATDELLTLNVLNEQGDTDILKLDNMLDLSVGDLYTFGEAGIEAKPFRVVAITRSADMYRRITAIEYHAEVYSENYEIPVLDYSDLDKVIDVKSLIINQDTYRQKDGTLMSTLYVSWDLDRAARINACKVFYSTDAGVSWEYFTETADRNCVISGVKIGSTYIIKVCAISSGFVSAGVLSTATYVTGKDNPPSNVSGLSATLDVTNSSKINLQWSNSKDLDLQGYYVYESGTLLTALPVKENRYTYQADATRIFYFSVVAVDNSFNSSMQAAQTSLYVRLLPDDVSGFAAVQQDTDRSKLNFSWLAAPNGDLSHYELRQGTNWDAAMVIATQIKAVQYQHQLTQDGNFTYLLKAVNNQGFYSAEARVSHYITLEPASVSGFIALQNGEYVDLHWSKHEEQDVTGYELREGLSFDNGVLVATGITTSNYTIKVSTERVYRCHIKAVNKALKYSLESTSANVYVDALPPKNIIKSYNELELKSGEKTNVEFGLSALNFQTFGGSFADYPNTKFGDVGGLNVLRLRKLDMLINPVGSAYNNYSDSGINATCVATGSSYKGSLVFKTTHIAVTEQGLNSLKSGYSGKGIFFTGVSVNNQYLLGETYYAIIYYRAISSKPISNLSKSPANLGTWSDISCELQPDGWTKLVAKLVAVKTGTDSVHYGFYCPTAVLNESVQIEYTLPQVAHIDKVFEYNQYCDAGVYTTTIKDMGQVLTANISADFRNTVLMYDVGAASLQLRSSRDGSNWTAWQEFKPGQYTFRYLQARVLISTTDASNSPEINQFTIAIDVPDNIQSGKATIGIGGKTIAFNREYYDIPVVITMALGENRFFQRTATTKQGFTGKVVDRNGNDVGGSIDWQAKGY